MYNAVHLSYVHYGFRPYEEEIKPLAELLHATDLQSHFDSGDAENIRQMVDEEAVIKLLQKGDSSSNLGGSNSPILKLERNGSK
eukprot:SAG22_NODE_2276_length_2762_cov_4.876455_1_plen_83_part_10